MILDGEVVPLEQTGLSYTAEDGVARDVLIETLGECRHYVLEQPHYEPLETSVMREIETPPGRYLFMGDNRDNSHDGRIAGTVPKSALAGPAGLNYWSWNWNGDSARAAEPADLVEQPDERNDALAPLRHVRRVLPARRDAGVGRGGEEGGVGPAPTWMEGFALVRARRVLDPIVARIPISLGVRPPTRRAPA